MAGKRKFEEHLAALEALRELPEEERLDPLRKALGHRNNLYVAKAADLVHASHLHQLIPELLAAFDRFFNDAEKNDPQCWAKNAISRSLAAFELQEPQVFLRGMRHVQLEAVWGGHSDTAGTLRATCALALVQCRGVAEPDLLAHLVELMADKDKSVRAEAARAIEQVGSPSAALLLRQRAVLGKDEPEVLGACYTGILGLEGVRAIPWIARFLTSGHDSAGEAALAIAATHSVEAFDALRRSLDQAHDPWFRSVVLSAIALTRQDAAVEFLLDMVKTESLDAEGAIESLVRAVPSPEAIRQLEEIAAGNSRLARALAASRQSSRR